MRTTFDREVDALYVRLERADGVAESEEVSPGVILDYDSRNRIVGVEVLHVSRRRSSREVARISEAIRPAGGRALKAVLDRIGGPSLASPVAEPQYPAPRAAKAGRVGEKSKAYRPATPRPARRSATARKRSHR